ncbi:MAG TPA: cysteine synthase A [Peptococcaceae bacterium]|nr:cysteine synthase A [Peptococcaceae bacterium]
MQVVSSVLELIGKTPVVELRKIVPKGSARVLVKLEYFNPAGSIKDRIALKMVEEAEKNGLLKPGGVIVEPTSGNTGIGLALVAAVKGYRLIIVMPESMSIERQRLLQGLGAELVLTPDEEGMGGAIARARHIVAENPGYFLLQQFENPANPQAHRETTAQEILAQTGGELDAFVCGVGTGGTLTGVGEVLKEKIPGIKVVAVEPAASPVLSGGKPGSHEIQGIGAGFVPAVLNTEIIDQVIQVSDRDAIETSKKLMQKEGIIAGISSGAAVYAALEVASSLGSGKTVLTIAPDTGERYLSTSLFLDQV